MARVLLQRSIERSPRMERLLALAAWAALGTGCSCRDTQGGSRPEDGPLVVRAEFPVHDEPGPVALADLNGDGKLDVVVGGGSVDVLLGDGQGGFARAPGAPLRGPAEAADFAFGDFDEDGRTDIVVAEHDRPRFFLLRGTERGGFEIAPGSPVLVDATPHLHTIAACDFDGDGHLDVVTDSWTESRLVLVAGNGDGTFAAPGRKLAVPRVPIHNLRVADMNADGRADVVTPAHESEAVTVLLGDGRGSFEQAPGSPYRSFGGFSKLALADLDLDGDTDVAEVHRSDASTQYRQDALSILLNDGTGRLAHARGSPLRALSGRVGTLAIGDVNGDGWPDVAALSESTHVLFLFHGGERGFESAGEHAPGGLPLDLALGDVDGDGRAEVFVIDASAERLLVLGERR